VPHLLEEILERERHPLIAVRHGCRPRFYGRAQQLVLGSMLNFCWSWFKKA